MIRKFFDAVATEPAGGVTSIAAMMATQGRMNTSDQMVATPIDITERKEETQKAQEPAPVETTTQTPLTEEVKPETPSPEKIEEQPAAPQKEETAIPQPTWQEVLRKHQPEAILKELGYDDKAVGLIRELKDLDPKMVAFFNHWKTNGNVDDYVRELATDYSKMSAEDVMRHQLRSEYPKASDAAINSLFNKKVIQAYNLNSEDEAELAEGRLLLEAEADKFRDTLISRQQEFLLPKPPEPKAPEPDLTEQRQQQEFEAYKAKIHGNPVTQNILSSNNYSLGDGEEKFNFPVDSKVLLDVMLNTDKWQETQYDIQRNPDGTVASYIPKIEHQLLTTLVAVYGTKFLDAYAKHYKSLGGGKVINQLENPKPTERDGQPTQAQSAPSNPAEAMARQGRFNSGGY